MIVQLLESSDNVVWVFWYFGAQSRGHPVPKGRMLHTQNNVYTRVFTFDLKQTFQHNNKELRDNIHQMYITV